MMRYLVLLMFLTHSLSAITWASTVDCSTQEATDFALTVSNPDILQFIIPRAE